jgi:hypothetical protein
MSTTQCNSCGNWTTEGKSQLKKRYREHPIYKTDFSKKPSQLIEDIRNMLCEARGKLYDIKAGLGWNERIEPAVGGITCAISYLYTVMAEMQKYEDGCEQIRKGICPDCGILMTKVANGLQCDKHGFRNIVEEE